MNLYQFYSYKNLDHLMHKDPGRFIQDVKSVLLDSSFQINAVKNQSVYCLKDFLEFLKLTISLKDNDVVILFHLTIRTLLIQLLIIALGKHVKFIIKTDYTCNKNGLTFIRAFVFRMINKLSAFLVCENIEGTEQLKKIGLNKTRFIPNSVNFEFFECGNTGRYFDFILVTRADDPRKNPLLTERIAQLIANQGYKVLLVGLEDGKNENLTKIKQMTHHDMLMALCDSKVFIGISDSESYWYLLVECAYIGIPCLVTNTGIASYLKSKSLNIKVIEDSATEFNIEKISNDAISMLAINEVLKYDINLDSHNFLKQAISDCIV